MSLPWLTVLTTPRRPQYLAGTLDVIDDAGAGARCGARKIIFVDGPASRVWTEWEVISLTADGPSAGSKAALWSILHSAAVAGAPYLLYFEDDVRLARNAIPAMQAFDVREPFGFLSFCKLNPSVDSVPGIRTVPDGGKFWGTVALKIPARSLARFAAPESKPPADYPFAADVWLGQQLQAGIVLPSIVRHIGAVSSIPGQENETLDGRFWYRAGLDYVGDDADALKVFPPQNREPGHSDPVSRGTDPVNWTGNGGTE